MTDETAKDCPLCLGEFDRTKPQVCVEWLPDAKYRLFVHWPCEHVKGGCCAPCYEASQNEVFTQIVDRVRERCHRDTASVLRAIGGSIISAAGAFDSREERDDASR